MKKIVTFLCAGMLALVANAQQSMINNPSNHVYFGLRASYDMTFPKMTANGNNVDAFKSGMGASIGGIVNIPIVANLYVEPGLNFYYHTYSLNDDMIHDMIGDVEEIAGAKLTSSFRNFGMRVPVMLGYHFDITNNVKLAIFTGPELNVGFTNKFHFTAELAGQKGSKSVDVYGEDGLFNRVDCAWKLGGSITVSDVYFGVSGGWGLLDMKQGDSNVAKIKMNALEVTLGYNF